MRRPLSFGLAALALTACSASDPEAGTPMASTDRPATNNVAGSLLAVGGPAGAHPEPQRGRIVLRRAGAHAIDITVPANGHFSAAVRPGTYLIRGYSPQYQGGRVPCDAPTPTITIRAAAVTQVDLYCQRK